MATNFNRSMDLVVGWIRDRLGADVEVLVSRRWVELSKMPRRNGVFVVEWYAVAKSKTAGTFRAKAATSLDALRELWKKVNVPAKPRTHWLIFASAMSSVRGPVGCTDSLVDVQDPDARFVEQEPKTCPICVGMNKPIEARPQ